MSIQVLSTEGWKKSKSYQTLLLRKKFLNYIYIFRILYVVGIYFGSIVVVKVVWDLAGIANALMTLPNLYMIYKCVDKNIYKQLKMW